MSDQSPATVNVAALDVTKTNIAVERLLADTSKPRHRFMLEAYYRHRYLEIAGRYEEIFAPDMMVECPVYHFHAAAINTKLEGKEAVKTLYRAWTLTNQTIFYAENEEVSVSDHYITSIGVLYQQVWGKAVRVNKTLGHLPRMLSDRLLKQILSSKGSTPDNDDMYLYRSTIQMIWPYDDQCRLVGEDVWEPDPDRAELIKLDRSQVLTAADARSLLDPLIKPLPVSA